MAIVETQFEDGIATVTINRPEALNALNPEVLEELGNSIRNIRGRSDIRVILLTGAGDKAFVAGADIKQMKELSVLEASRFSKKGQDVLFAFEQAPQISIAAVNGFALGGGCELAMACDLVYASENSKFGQPEVNLGVTPGFGGSQRLLRLVGLMKAREMILTGNMIDAAEAYRVGLVAQVFTKAEFVGKVREIAQTIASKGSEAIFRAKVALREGSNTDLTRGCAIEQEQFALCFAHPDQKEGMNAFLEKRKPNWKRES